MVLVIFHYQNYFKQNSCYVHLVGGDIYRQQAATFSALACVSGIWKIHKQTKPLESVTCLGGSQQGQAAGEKIKSKLSLFKCIQNSN
jgi:hypothetical protein